MADSIAQLKQMHSAVLGQTLVETRNGQDLLDRLKQGQTDLHLVLNWDGRDQTLVLLKVQGDRVIFHNPLGHFPGLAQGAAITDSGPARQAEGNNLESVTQEQFLQFFSQRRACGLVPV